MSEKKFDPQASAARKRMPMFDGCMMYFPDALLAVAAFSLKANEKHNPGEPLHWAKHKSTDQANCVGRHLIDIGPNWDAVDPEFGEMHAVALAWRSLALLQMVIEAKRAGLSVRDYIEKLKRDAEQAEMEQKRREPIQKAKPEATAMPVPTTLWYCVGGARERRTVHTDPSGKITLLNDSGGVMNTYESRAQLEKDIVPGYYARSPK
jgi:hypothetical protein